METPGLVVRDSDRFRAPRLEPGSPFFDAWGVPDSEKAKQSLKDLPVWMSDLLLECIGKTKGREKL